MRKIELALVVITVAVATAWWNKTTPPVASPTPRLEFTKKLMTRSGRFEILPNPYGLAGLFIGCTDTWAVAVLGQPTSKADEDKETHSWTYASGLHLVFLENRLISVGGEGRWAFSNRGVKDSTLFMQPRSRIRERFGEPTRVDQSAWVYNTHPGELTIHFNNDAVSQVYIVGEIKPTPIAP